MALGPPQQGASGWSAHAGDVASAAADERLAAAHAGEGGAAALPDERLAAVCAIYLNSEGTLLTPLPSLLAAAVSRLVLAAAADDAAAGQGVLSPPPPPTRLHGVRPPAISLPQYAARLARYCKCSPVCYLAAFAYMRRLHSSGAVRVDVLTAHRLMACGLVVATKFYDDKYYSNAHYAEVAGVSLQELNAIELDLLFRLDFRTRVSPAELSTALREMEALAAGFAGHSRLLCGGACQQQPTAAAAGSFAPAPPAAAAKTAAAALADMEAEGSADTTLALGGRPSAASSSCEWEAAEEGQSDEPMQQCCAASAAALSSWGAAGAAAAAAEEAEAEAEGAAERMAPLRRSSRNRCSVEATRPLRFERGLHGAEQPGW